MAAAQQSDMSTEMCRHRMAASVGALYWQRCDRTWHALEHAIARLQSREGRVLGREASERVRTRAHRGYVAQKCGRCDVVTTALQPRDLAVPTARVAPSPATRPSSTWASGAALAQEVTAIRYCLYVVVTFAHGGDDGGVCKLKERGLSARSWPIQWRRALACWPRSRTLRTPY